MNQWQKRALVEGGVPDRRNNTAWVGWEAPGNQDPGCAISRRARTRHCMLGARRRQYSATRPQLALPIRRIHLQTQVMRLRHVQRKPSGRPVLQGGPCWLACCLQGEVAGPGGA